ncbi:MAG TPA: alpha-hydroxy acid oxidase [Paludibaculum sp.]|jgi:isopentenyl diphosphate isomerase/L-lactate dehydrogenase-like FMN-dependent dehydrogenase
MDHHLNRRRFFQFVTGSPLLAHAQSQPDPIRTPAEALNVMDFEAAARKAIPPAHFGYLATGVEDDRTLQANRDAYARVQLRPRRLVNVSHVDTSTELFGSRWDFPLGLSPVGNMKAFHPDAELCAARAATARHTHQILSTLTTTPIEQVMKAAGTPLWYQLYATTSWQVTEKLVQRAEAAGCPVMALTVDLPAGRNLETLERFKRLDKRPCANCHTPGPEAFYRRKPMFEGIDTKGVAPMHDTADWAFIDRLRGITKMKLLLKGISTREDATLALQHGVDGLIVSNHGGRAEESGRGTLESLPEVVAAVAGRIPVLLDGGIRRGIDIFKALALGASAVCIGRPYVWGVGAFGQPGVERVLEILQAEFVVAMKQCGIRSIREFTPGAVHVRP